MSQGVREVITSIIIENVASSFVKAYAYQFLNYNWILQARE